MHLSERYIKLLRDRDYRLEWAEKIGMGFELPGRSGSEKLAKAPSIGQLGRLIRFKKTGYNKSFRIWWTRTQRIRTEVELSFAAILADTTDAPRYQRIAAKALHLHQLGLGSTTIARRLGTTRKTVIKALAWLARSRQDE